PLPIFPPRRGYSGVLRLVAAPPALRSLRCSLVVPPVRSSFAPRGRERAAPGPWLFNRRPLPALARGEDQVSQVRGESHFLCMPRSLSPASSSRLGLPPGVSTRPAVVRLAARERGRTHGHLARNGRVPREP